MARSLSEKLDDLNEELAGFGPYRLAVFPVPKLRLLQKNARYMDNDTFRRLVQNVKKDGGLASLPLVYTADGTNTVLSGNHRVMAAKEAGLEEILCLTVTHELSSSEAVAIQLSHNAIEGKDDLAVLKELYDAIESVDLKAYSGIDEETRKLLDELSLQAIKAPAIKMHDIHFLFLPEEGESLRMAVEECGKILSKDDSFVAKLTDYEKFFEAVVTAKEKLNIRNSAVALMELVSRGRQQIEQEHTTETDT